MVTHVGTGRRHAEQLGANDGRKRTTAITAIPAVMEDRFTTLTSFLGCLCLDEMSLTREPLMKLNKKHKHKKSETTTWFRLSPSLSLFPVFDHGGQQSES